VGAGERRAINAGKKGEILIVFGVHGALVGVSAIERVIEKQVGFAGGIAEEEDQIGGERVFGEGVAGMGCTEAHEAG
jgi:hypothetical protein